MYINLLHRKTGNEVQLSFHTTPILRLKQLALKALTSPKYWSVMLIAQTATDIEFIAQHFSNVPIPDIDATKAIWTGDMASFIILNFPLSKNLDQEEIEAEVETTE